MSSGIKITMADIRSVHMCSRGGRKFFERHGLDWLDFLKNGIEVEEIENIDDEMGKEVAIAARKRQSI